MATVQGAPASQAERCSPTGSAATNPTAICRLCGGTDPASPPGVLASAPAVRTAWLADRVADRVQQRRA